MPLPGWSGLRRIVTLAALLALWAGLGCAQNPSYFPHWLPAGPIFRTHAKPPGSGHFANFDPEAYRIEVRPLVSTNPTRTQHLIIATVMDDKGVPRRKRRVEWMLEGAGNIVEVDESGYLAARGYKVDNRYAVSYTDYFEHVITRGNDDPSDDFKIQPGQSWCIVTSAVEGDTQLTVFAPEVFDHDKRTAVVTMHWVDAQWQFPASASVRAGSSHILTTNLFRHSDRAPIPNYRVRYTLLDGGPAAQLLPNRSREVVVASDAAGKANAEIAQLGLQPGLNRINIEVIRPADPTNPAGTPVVIAKSETTIDWQAPQIGLTVEAPPVSVVMQEIPATITLTNNGQVETQPGDVTMDIPIGMSFLRSTPPPAGIVDNAPVWRIPALPGGRSESIRVFFRATDTGVFSTTARAKTADGLRAENGASLRVERAQLQLKLDTQKNGLVGEPISLPIEITNPGTGPAANLTFQVLMEDGLEVRTPGGAVTGKVERQEQRALDAKETRTIPFRVWAIRPGRFELAVFARADGGLQAQARCVIDVQQAQVEIRRTGPPSVQLNRDGTWALKVTNAGPTPLPNATIRERLPEELVFRNATEGGRYDSRNGEITWAFGTLNPGEERVVRYTATGSRLTTRSKLTGILTAAATVEKTYENSVEVLGVPALRVEVLNDVNPVETGARAGFTIRLVNQGTLPADNIEVDAMVTPSLRILSGRNNQIDRVAGQRVTFVPVSRLMPGQTALLTLPVQADREGDARIRVEIRTPMLPEPLIEEQALQVIPAPVRNRNGTLPR